MKTQAKLYQVSIEGTEFIFDVNENDTLLGGILRAGTGIPYECNAGGCGSCKYILIEGEVIDDLEDSTGLRGSDKRKNKHLACISRPQSNCVIRIKPDDQYTPKHRPTKLQAKLQSIEKLTHDLWEFQFVSSQPACFLPGQYAKLDIPGVVGPRSYSMCNNENARGQWAFQIKRVEGGAASSILFNGPAQGVEVTIDAPYSIAHLQPTSPRSLVCIAGGSGLAPMVSILHGAAKAPQGTKKPILYYGARKERDVISKEYLDRIPEFNSNEQYIPIVSEIEPKSKWLGAKGFVHEYLKNNLGNNCQEFDYYMAGPPPMVDAVRRHLILDRKIPVEQIHYDRFY